MEEAVLEAARAEVAPEGDLLRDLLGSWVPDASVLGGIASARAELGLPNLRDTPPPLSPDPKTWVRSYRNKWVRPKVWAEEESWWAEHAAKPKHSAFLSRAGAPGMWLNILLQTAEPGARWGDAVHAARMLVADVVRTDVDLAAEAQPRSSVSDSPRHEYCVQSSMSVICGLDFFKAGATALAASVVLKYSCGYMIFASCYLI